MAKWPFIPWRQSTASKFRPDSLNYGCLSVSKSGEVSAGDSNNKAVPVLPTGSVIPFAGKTAPTGWLMCQGQAVSRTTYAQLFSVIGTTFGSGDGSTTFNLPDIRGRVAVGVDSDANLGGTAGAPTVALTADQNGPHNHKYTSRQTNNDNMVDKGSFYGLPTVIQSDTYTSSSGNGTAHENRQPSLYLYQIIKV